MYNFFSAKNKQELDELLNKTLEVLGEKKDSMDASTYQSRQQEYFATWQEAVRRLSSGGSASSKITSTKRAREESGGGGGMPEPSRGFTIFLPPDFSAVATPVHVTTTTTPVPETKELKSRASATAAPSSTSATGIHIFAEQQKIALQATIKTKRVAMTALVCTSSATHTDEEKAILMKRPVLLTNIFEKFDKESETKLAPALSSCSTEQEVTAILITYNKAAQAELDFWSDYLTANMDMEDERTSKKQRVTDSTKTTPPSALVSGSHSLSSSSSSSSIHTLAGPARASSDSEEKRLNDEIALFETVLHHDLSDDQEAYFQTLITENERKLDDNNWEHTTEYSTDTNKSKLDNIDDILEKHKKPSQQRLKCWEDFQSMFRDNSPQLMAFQALNGLTFAKFNKCYLDLYGEDDTITEDKFQFTDQAAVDKEFEIRIKNVKDELHLPRIQKYLNIVNADKALQHYKATDSLVYSKFLEDEIKYVLSSCKATEEVETFAAMALTRLARSLAPSSGSRLSSSSNSSSSSVSLPTLPPVASPPPSSPIGKIRMGTALSAEQETAWATFLDAAEGLMAYKQEWEDLVAGFHDLYKIWLAEEMHVVLRITDDKNIPIYAAGALKRLQDRVMQDSMPSPATPLPAHTSIPASAATEAKTPLPSSIAPLTGSAVLITKLGSLSSPPPSSPALPSINLQHLTSPSPPENTASPRLP
ncbi:hypothetical protein BH10PSE19_BH10PSE19_11200 [soil metagenome]